MKQLILGLLIPFAGTAGGAAMVFVLKKRMGREMERILLGFAAGVMVAASVWSLIIPALEQESTAGIPSFVLTAVGFWLGIGFLLLLDGNIPHLHLHADHPEGKGKPSSKTAMMLAAVTIHNIPEGMAVGAVYAALLASGTGITVAAAFALSLGIAIQNFPEGAIISMPLYEEGMPKGKAFLLGAFSGAVEPVAGLLTVLLSELVQPWLPVFLSFAAGAMLYVVVEELIPEMSEGEHSNFGTIAFGAGFTVMMLLDVLL